jgi:hypothetical protein
VIQRNLGKLEDDIKRDPKIFETSYKRSLQSYIDEK